MSHYQRIQPELRHVCHVMHGVNLWSGSKSV